MLQNSVMEESISDEMLKAFYFLCIYFQSYENEDAIIQACVRSFHKIFTRYIEAEEMFLETQVTGDETGK